MVVQSDSSGDIYAGRVGGDFSVNEDGSGSITHESISGRITLPSHQRIRLVGVGRAGNGNCARRSACRRNIGPKLWRSKNR